METDKWTPNPPNISSFVEGARVRLSEKSSYYPRQNHGEGVIIKERCGHSLSVMVKYLINGSTYYYDPSVDLVLLEE